MTPEKWQQIKSLFQAALECPPGERAALLAEACAGDAGLRAEVESLLAAHEQPGSFLESPVNANTNDDQPITNHFLVGQSIENYKVLSVLGSGGMGTVYLAEDTRMGRQVALKVLPIRFAGDAQRVRRFRQEARAISALNHPNILTIYEISQAQTSEGETHLIATEFVKGRTLRACLNDVGMTFGEVLDVIIQTSNALVAAHQAGIIHRDIKPENVMLRPDGVVKVLDFGLAKLTESRTLQPAPPNFSTVNTNPGQIMGTISYMSPEQARGLDVDERSDIFSLGVVFYELITGRAPFAGATTGDVLVSILDREPPPMTNYAPLAPIELQRIVGRSMAKDVEQRYQNAAELLSDLKEFKQELKLAERLKPSDGKGLLDLPVAKANPKTTNSPSALATNVAARPTNASKSLLKRLLQPARPLPIALAILALMLVAAAIYKFRPTQQHEAISSIAVLPFLNVNGGNEMEYLPDGITESLMQSLSQLPGLSVMASSTVFSYKGHATDPRQIGKDLKVNAIVTGRVQRQDQKLIVLVELVSADNGARLWSERYQRPMADLLAMQEEIAREISVKLKLRLASDGKQLAQQPSSRLATNSEAYLLYLKGRYLYRQNSRESQEKALDYFNQALALEPRFALAHSWVSIIYMNFSSQYLRPKEAIPKARQAAVTALSLDDQLAEAHLAMAHVRLLDWDWAEAEKEFKRTLEINPNLTEAMFYYVGTLNRLKKFDESLILAKRFAELDPLSPQSFQAMASLFHYSRQYDRAIEQYRKIIEMNPSVGWVSNAQRDIGRIMIQQKRFREGVEELRKSVELNRTEAGLAWLAHGYGAAGQKAEALVILKELQTAATQHWVAPVYFARIYIGLGEYEQAIGWLQKAYEEQSDHLVHINVEPVYDPLHSDPRFIRILRGVGFTQ